MIPISRRTFLQLLGLGSGGLMVGAVGCDTNTVEPLGAGPSFAFLTPQGEFYFQNGSLGPVPTVARDAWRLTIAGGTAGDKVYSFADLMRLAEDHKVEYLKTMQCVFDIPREILISNGLWTGIPLSVLLAEAGVPAAAKRLHFTAYDVVEGTGYDSHATNLPVGRVTSPDPAMLPILLAYKLNGEDLGPQHGFPVRLVVPEQFGFKSIKWIKRVEFSTSDEPWGFYETFADDRATIQIYSNIQQPRGGASVAGPDVAVRGFALGGPVAAAAVAVSVDGGAFNPVPLLGRDAILQRLREDGVNIDGLEQTERNLPYPYPNVWALWETTLTGLAKGDHTIRVRATDAAGAIQPVQNDRPDFDNGDNSIRSVSFTVT